MPIKMTAVRQTTGSYGAKFPGEPLEVATEEEAKELEMRGVASRGEAEGDKKMARSRLNKMAAPTENKAADVPTTAAPAEQTAADAEEVPAGATFAGGGTTETRRASRK